MSRHAFQKWLLEIIRVDAVTIKEEVTIQRKIMNGTKLRVSLRR